ncbi:hypothetical protein [Mesorhizobium sp.]|uniref:hypothetical protein n=1 Tax=Mesorhizobium sp. TaxID=1871066 RepID=UPI0025EF98FF|nr:hypothetical protein [Mesorhizobium sp.]
MVFSVKTAHDPDDGFHIDELEKSSLPSIRANALIHVNWPLLFANPAISDAEAADSQLSASS